jgi:ribonuclease BN (tRNA processing enzyme)
MNVVILPSAPFDPEGQEFLTSFLVDDALLIDAGCAGISLDLAAQAAIGHVFLTHSHADHLLSLPMLVTNTLDRRDAPLTVHATAEVLGTLRSDVFNGRIWPDFVSMSERGRPLIRLEEVRPEEPVRVDGFVMTAVEVDHAVPTVGYVVEGPSSAVAFCPDTGPTERIWRVAARARALKAVYIGAALPDSMRELARRACHLTPSLLRDEITKMPADVRVIAMHLKPQARAEIERELAALGIDRLSVGICGRRDSW